MYHSVIRRTLCTLCAMSMLDMLTLCAVSHNVQCGHSVTSARTLCIVCAVLLAITARYPRIVLAIYCPH